MIKMNRYKCQKCGATYRDTVETECPICGSNYTKMLRKRRWEN